MRVIATLRKLLADERAATAVEYGLILSLIFLAIVGGVAALGSETSGVWNRAASETSAAMAAD